MNFQIEMFGFGSGIKIWLGSVPLVADAAAVGGGSARGLDNRAGAALATVGAVVGSVRRLELPSDVCSARRGASAAARPVAGQRVKARLACAHGVGRGDAGSGGHGRAGVALGALL